MVDQGDVPRHYQAEDHSQAGHHCTYVETQDVKSPHLSTAGYEVYIEGGLLNDMTGYWAVSVKKLNRSETDCFPYNVIEIRTCTSDRLDPWAFLSVISLGPVTRTLYQCIAATMIQVVTILLPHNYCPV